MVTLLISACQTPAKPEPAAKEEKLVEAQRALVRNALDSGKPESALESLRNLLREHPSDPSLHNLMGLTQLSLKNAPRAVKEFQIAYKLDKQVATGLNLSSALIESGDFERAVKLLTQLTEAADRDNYAFKERIDHNLGYCYVRQGRLHKAEEWFKQALEENPTFFPSHLELARLYEKTKRPAMAMTEYRRSMDFCVICLEPVQALTALYVKNGRSAEARRLLIQFGKLEGVAPEDREKAGHLLNQMTISGLPQPRRRG